MDCWERGGKSSGVRPVKLPLLGLPRMESGFPAREFAVPNVQKIPIDAQVASRVEARLDEARAALAAGAHLSVIFLRVGVLEAVLPGAGQRAPARSNQANATPKTANGSPRRFHEWTFAQLIDVARSACSGPTSGSAVTDCEICETASTPATTWSRVSHRMNTPPRCASRT